MNTLRIFATVLSFGVILGSADMNTSSGETVAQGNAPIVATTLGSVNVFATRATLKMSVEGVGNGQAYFQYGPDTNYGTETVKVPIVGINGTAGFDIEAAPLQPAQTYHFRAMASNDAGVTAGADLVFTTPPLAALHSALFTKGQPVPGAGTGGVPAGAVWASFGVPSLLGTGDAAGFSAKVNAPTGSLQGVFSGPLGAPVLRVKTGEAATDASGMPLSGVVFKTFKEPVFGDADHWAVLARVQGSGVTAENDTGVWAGEPGQIFEVAREGAVAPGTSGARFKSFTAILRPNPATVIFTAKLTGEGVTAASDASLWAWSLAHGLALAEREGDLLVLGRPEYPSPVKSFKTIQAVSGSPGHGRHDGQNYGGQVSFADGSQAIVNYEDANVAKDVSTVNLLPGGVRASKFGPPSWSLGSLSYSVLATLVPDGVVVTPQSKQALLRNGFIVAQQGREVSGMEEVRYARFKDPVSTENSGTVFDAFFAKLEGDSVDTTNDTTVFRTSGGPGSLGLRLMAREGGEPPGAEGTTWKSFSSLSVLAERGALFTAKLGGSATTADDAGLWGEDLAGVLRLIFREGGPVAGRTLKSFTILAAVSGSPGQRRAYVKEDGRKLIWRASFTDGASSVVTTLLP